MMKSVVFRVDASLEIGTGHVMRCLTLADALSDEDTICTFITRLHDGNLIDVIQRRGYVVHVLSTADEGNLGLKGDYTQDTSSFTAPYHWLGATQIQDAEMCIPHLVALQPDWLISDHYALDAVWDLALAPYYRKLMVIDDLADRRHECDLLLDQTYGRDPEDYRDLVPDRCRLLCGSEYALLRPEFAALRAQSLARRAATWQLKHLLISLGGVDRDNVTGKVLRALRTSALPSDCRISVVLGPTAPWFLDVQNEARKMPWSTEVLVDVREMAKLMAESDLAIGAAGSTSWERCCLGLPSLVLVLAKNQLPGAVELQKVGAAVVVETQQQITIFLKRLQVEDSVTEILTKLSEVAASVADGKGCQRTVKHLLESTHA